MHRFTVRGTTGEFFPRSVAYVKSHVIDQLSAFFDVQDVTLETSSFMQDPLGITLLEWPYSAQVRLTTRVDYGDIRDVDSLVAHAFYVGAGALPTVTADNEEQGQGTDTTTGLSLQTVLVLGVVAFVAIAVVKVT